MDDNAQMVLYSPELKDTTNVRDKYMRQVEPCAYDEQNGYLRNDGTVGSLTTDGSSPKHNNRIVEPIDCRVRKLTDRECFRLQGVKDEDFERVRANQSKSSCYHLAGDSITVSVLMALFGEMLDIDWRSKVDRLVEDLCNGG
jgi:site-specific DNA-cytosine methylase